MLQLRSVLVSTIAGVVAVAGCSDGDDDGVGGPSPKSPPDVSITAPPNGTTYQLATAITFEGTGSDPDGGAVNLTWTSSADGFLGTGTSVTRDDLTLGSHTIQLLGVDDELQRDSTTIGLTIVDTTIVAYALRFDGAQGAETADSDSLDLSDGFTIEMWVQPFDVEAGLQHILSKWGEVGSYHVAIGDTGSAAGALQFASRDSFSTTIVHSSATLADSVWQHVAVVVDTGVARLYIDGQLDTTAAGLVAPLASDDPLSLGRMKTASDSVGNFYSGLLDEVRIWNVSRTASQIDANKDVRIDGDTPGLVAYWRLDEGAGDDAADETGAGHDLRLGDAAGPDAADPAWFAGGKP